MRAQATLPIDPIALFAEDGSEAPERAAQFLKSFAHRDRLKILCCLVEQELSVAEIESHVGTSQSALSQHLGRLKDEGILSSRRDGRQIIYRISDPTALSLISVLYRRFCEGKVDRQR